MSGSKPLAEVVTMSAGIGGAACERGSGPENYSGDLHPTPRIEVA